MTALLRLSVVLALTASLAAADETDGVLREGRTRVAVLEKFYSTIDCAWRETTSGNATAGNSREKVFLKRLTLDGSMVKLEVTAVSTTGHEGKVTRVGAVGVAAVNPRYVFNLKRKSKESPYLIHYHGQTDRFGLVAEVRRAAQTPCCFLGLPLSRWLTEPSFRFEGVKPDEGALKLVGRFIPEEGDVVDEREVLAKKWDAEILPRVPFQFELVVRPDLHWCIQSARATYKHAVESVAITYQAGPDGYPVPKDVVTRNQGNDGFDRTTKVVFQDFASKRTPATEFTLTHYGLPELDVPEPRQNLLWVVFAVAGVLALGAAWWLRHYVRRAPS
ncbi:MAG: hypothetical protein ACRC33_27795 [Gemmataceae bacterium]